MKHFLPRYLDLIGQFEFPTHSTELSFSRLIPFVRNEWTKEEIILLDEFSKAFFKDCLKVYPIPSFTDTITTILIMFRGVDFDLRELFDIEALLKIWEAEQSKESVLHFRDLYFHGFSQYDRSKLSSSFGDKALANILSAWLDSEKVNKIFSDSIEKIIIGNSDLEKNDESELNLLYEILQAKKKAQQ